MSKNWCVWRYVPSICVLGLILVAAGCTGYTVPPAPPVPAVTISPSQVSFATTAQGATSNSIIVTVTNSGTASLTISSVVAGGVNPGDFTSANVCSGVLNPYGGSCTIALTFKPTATGRRSETITLNDNAPDSPQIITVSGTATPPPQPAVTLSQNPVTFPPITQGTTSTPVVVTLTNSGAAALTISSIVASGANTTDFSSTNTCTAAVAAGANCALSLTFKPTVSGGRSEIITVTDNAPDSPQVIQVNGTANPIALTVTPASAAIATGQTTQFTASDNDADDTVVWSVASANNSPAGTIDASGNYTAPSGAQSAAVTVTATSQTDGSKSASATINVVAPGTVTATNNVQVAQYTIAPASAAKVSVQFGLDTQYGLTTWTQPTPSNGGVANPNGGTVSLFVAGMKASSTYHMRGVVEFADGSTFLDADQMFTTGALPAGTVPNITATTTAGMTPQSGIELLDLINFGPSSGKFPLVVTDLAGNLLWTYNPVLASGVFADPIKLTPNGHFLINFNGGSPDGVNSMMQEVDLGGNLIWQMTGAQLNAALAAATCTGCNITVTGTHHDFAILPNGHVIVLAGTQQVISGTTVTGDVLIDLDQNHNPVWLWNEFDHLDTNRQPYMYPDWTHTNAVIYSKDDGNLIISIRHQNWLIKIDYNNGAGAGDVLWRLGYQGDFTLLNADGTPDTNNHDWFFAQHGPSFTTTNTTGKFGLGLFDNGDDRGVVDVAGGTCGVSGQPACFSTVPVFEIDETAKTATFAVHPTTEDYSFFGGNAEVLANGNIEYDECSNGSLAGSNGTVIEATQSSSPQTAWKTVITGQYVYRGMRIGSLYPGVQW